MPLALAIHLATAILALLIGPVAIWARRAVPVRPHLHRLTGRVWVALMVTTALSTLFMRTFDRPNVAGYSFLHLLVPVVMGTLAYSFHRLRRRDIVNHRRSMQRLYVFACVVAGLFTLLPNRMIGHWLWHDVLGSL